MLKIGDFAWLGQVSVRMLRNDDELGLLVPAHVDPWTNYRSREIYLETPRGNQDAWVTELQQPFVRH